MGKRELFVLVLTGRSSTDHSVVFLCDPMDYSLPGCSVHGIRQAGTLEWVAIPFSRESSWPRDWIQSSCFVGRFFTVWATREAQIEAEPKTYVSFLCSKSPLTLCPYNIYISIYFVLLQYSCSFFLKKKVFVFFCIHLNCTCKWYNEPMFNKICYETQQSPTYPCPVLFPQYHLFKLFMPGYFDISQ